MEIIYKLAVMLISGDIHIVVPLSITIVICIFVYFKYIKPFYTSHILNTNKTDKMLEDISDIHNKVSMTNNKDMLESIELLELNHEAVKRILEDMCQIKKELEVLKTDFASHDKDYNKYLNNLILEFTRLSSKVEANLFSARSIK